MLVAPFVISAFLRTASAETEVKLSSPDADSTRRLGRKRNTMPAPIHHPHQQQHSEEKYDPFLGLAEYTEEDSHRRYLQDGEMSMPTAEECAFCPDGLTVPEDTPLPQDSNCGMASTFAASLNPANPVYTTMCPTVQMAQAVCCPPVEAAVPEAAAPTCTFCPSGIPDPDLVLPTQDGTTCGTAGEYSATLDADDSLCTTVKLAEGFCCPGPDVPVQLPEETEPDTEATVPVQLPETTTEAPAAATEAPVTTTESPPATTEAPVTTTEAPATEAPIQIPETTEAPPATTEALVQDLPAEEDVTEGCSKSAKAASKSAKATSKSSKSVKKCPSAKSSKTLLMDAKAEKTDGAEKTSKTPKEPMAKVAKEPGVKGVDSKSGKEGETDAVVMDSKAEKKASSNDDSAKAGKGDLADSLHAKTMKETSWSATKNKGAKGSAKGEDTTATTTGTTRFLRA